MPIKKSTKMRISITIMPDLNLMLEELSKKSGNSKSNLIETAIQSFFSVQMEKDLKKLAKINFQDLPGEKEWSLIQSKWN